MAMVPGASTKAQGGEYGPCLRVLAWYTGTGPACALEGCLPMKGTLLDHPHLLLTPLAPSYRPTEHQLK